MAASRECVSGSSSSEDEDEKLRFREAAWSFLARNGTGKEIPAGAAASSNRVTVNQHDLDGNELQTTPEFRAHVAKKLGALLDSFISNNNVSETVQPAKEQQEDHDGFRLFTTSVPGVAPPPPAPRRRIPISSDSDSEQEMRLKEAAVSVADILTASAISQPASSPPSPPAENDDEGGKKKMKTQHQKGSAVEADSDSQCTILYLQDTIHTKKKKRKKKRAVAEDVKQSSMCEEPVQRRKKGKALDNGDASKERKTEVIQEGGKSKDCHLHCAKKKKKKKEKSEA